ncbi:MAG: TetR family transcriptional regulator [Deltaproteobacteria bacterium]|nr:TetR family transcriptional regulator [Deltaproteobacteria bacterium]
MTRKIPDRRFEELADCAARVFIDQGYRRTQMADVAEALGVAKGTLYLYVESKEALFDLALRCADTHERVRQPAALPIATPKPGATAAYVRDRLAANQVPALAAALAKKRVTDPAEELAEVVRELYAVLARNRRSIKLLDTSARDLPELAALWFEAGRDGLMATLAQYLERRIRSGKLRAVPDVTAAARLIIETTVFWAVHRHWDPHPQKVDDKVALDTVVRFIVGALA